MNPKFRLVALQAFGVCNLLLGTWSFLFPVSLVTRLLPNPFKEAGGSQDHGNNNSNIKNKNSDPQAVDDTYQHYSSTTAESYGLHQIFLAVVALQCLNQEKKNQVLDLDHDDQDDPHKKHTREWMMLVAIFSVIRTGLDAVWFLRSAKKKTQQKQMSSQAQDHRKMSPWNIAFMIGNVALCVLAFIATGDAISKIKGNENDQNAFRWGNSNTITQKSPLDLVDHSHTLEHKQDQIHPTN